MALTIATGFVVDDAIVMIENIARYIEAGEPPLQAALKGAQQIGFTIVSLTVSLIAVLIPLLFMGDIVGRLFREFAVTLSVTILVSAVVSLTLTPMMCARLLQHTPEAAQGRFYRASERVFKRTIERYGTSLRWVLGHQTATLLVAFGTLVARSCSTSSCPRASSRCRTPASFTASPKRRRRSRSPPWRSGSKRWPKVILQDPAVESLSSFIGVDGINTTLNTGRMQINLKPLEERRVERQRRHSPPAAASWRRCRASRSTCSRCRTSRSKTASAAPSTSTASSAPMPRSCPPGRRA